MMNLLIISIAIILLVGLLYCEKAEWLKSKLVVKTSLSCLFIVTVLVQPHPVAGFYYILLAGLIFCLGGDVFLALPGQRMFLFGLVSFLLGHVFYVIGFFYLAAVNSWSAMCMVAALIVSGAVFLWLRPHLGTMLIPVAVYIVVISIMLIGAGTVLGDAGVNSAGRVTVFIGAVSFYISDLFVARDRFLKPQFVNRLIGLPLYYGGQFLLAFSVGLIK